MSKPARTHKATEARRLKENEDSRMYRIRGPHELHRRLQQMTPLEIGAALEATLAANIHEMSELRRG